MVITAVAVTAVLFIAIIVFLLWGVNYSSGRGKGANINEYDEGYSMSEFSDVIRAGKEYARSLPYTELSIKSHDGISLSARYIENTESDKLMILMHGYRSHGINDFSVIVKVYYEMGFSILIPDQRAHGKSGGRYITYGVKERFDCAAWARYGKETLGKKRMILDGISMGGTTVLLATEAGLPNEVRGIIADCSFTSPHEIISRYITGMKLPARPIMPCLNIFLNLIAGYDAYSVSTVDAMRRNKKIPVLFVHGEDDNFVPCDMSRRAYEACTAKKHIVTVPGADHGMSYLTDTERLNRELRSFISEACGE